MADSDARDQDRPGGPFRFRVSDSVDVPLRGHMLRLRLLDGRPAVADLGKGRRLRVSAPTGAAREVTILDHATTSGRTTQARLDRVGELDVIISDADAAAGDRLIGIGWTAEGPVDRKAGAG